MEARAKITEGLPIDAAPGGPADLPVFFDGPQAIIPGSTNFMLKVTPLESPKYESEAKQLDASVIQPWVARYIHPAARYPGSGPFPVGGLDAPKSRNELYTLPQDANYRGLIAVASAADAA